MHATFLLIMLAMTLWISQASAQTYHLVQTLLGTGGTFSTSSGFSMNSTAGQQVIGPAASSGFSYGQGIWEEDNAWKNYFSFTPLAVQLYLLTSSIEPGGGAVIKWNTATETNNYGFYVQRKSTVNGSFADLPDNFVQGHGTTLQQHSYVWIDSSARTGTYYYRLKQVDLTGAYSYSSTITLHVSGVEAVKPQSGLPHVFALAQNYPNPFNPATMIEYQLPKESFVRIRLYNALGQQVRALVDENEQAGFKSLRFDAAGLTSGVYFYRISAGSFTDVKKMLLMK
jgi:hypothetical protein